MYLGVQFVFSTTALHFLLEWIRRLYLIALWSLGFLIPYLDFSCENCLEPLRFFSSSGKWRPLFLKLSRKIRKTFLCDHCKWGHLDNVDQLIGLQNNNNTLKDSWLWANPYLVNEHWTVHYQSLYCNNHLPIYHENVIYCFHFLFII